MFLDWTFIAPLLEVFCGREKIISDGSLSTANGRENLSNWWTEGRREGKKKALEHTLRSMAIARDQAKVETTRPRTKLRGFVELKKTSTSFTDTLCDFFQQTGPIHYIYGERIPELVPLANATVYELEHLNTKLLDFLLNSEKKLSPSVATQEQAKYILG